MTAQDQLVDRFTIVRQIGSGGLTTVYQAHDRLLDREVAVKQLLPRHAADASARGRFILGGRSITRHELPNLVAVLDTLSGAGAACLILEYMPGGSLDDLLRPGRPLALPRVIELAQQLCETLQQAHQLGLVHRDIKPANILFDASGNARLADFAMIDVPRTAFAREFVPHPAGAEEPEAAPVGGLVYTAPEQVLKAKLDGRCDLYALGAVLYQSLTGVPCLPVSECVSLASAKEMILARRPRPLRELNPEVPQWLEAAVLRALEKDAERRFADAGEMQAALLAQAPVPAEVDPSIAARVASGVHAEQQAGARVADRRLLALKNTLVGSCAGAAAGLLLGVTAYAVRAALIGIGQTMREGAVPAIIVSVLLAAVAGAVMGRVASS